MTQETITSQENGQIHASFRQKSASVSLVVISSIAIYYFVQAYGLLQSGQSMPDGALLLIVSTFIAIIVVEAVMQIVLVIGVGKVSSVTKRDEIVGMKATRNAYFVLMIGALATFGSAFLAVTPFVMANLVLLAFILAEIIRFASQLVYYQRTE